MQNQSTASSIIHSGRETPDYTDSEDLHDTIGQLSLDDASQLRYHGKASGLHLLGQTERVDRRAENGIWYVCRAEVRHHSVCLLMLTFLFSFKELSAGESLASNRKTNRKGARIIR